MTNDQLDRELDRLREAARREIQLGSEGFPAQIQSWVERTLNRAVSETDLTEWQAQAVCCGALILSGWPELSAERLEAIGRHTSPLLRPLLEHAAAHAHRWKSGKGDVGRWLRQGTGAAADLGRGREEAAVEFYEQLQARQHAKVRARLGVFYTPRSIARHVVSRVDSVLRDEFGLRDGLADRATWEAVRQQFPHMAPPVGVGLHESFVRVMDPACGAGVFLTEVVDCVHRTMVCKWSGAGHAEQEVRRRWNEYVARDLLPRIYGVELQLPACFLATLLIAKRLSETGYDFAWPGRIGVYLSDSLAGPIDASLPGPDTPWWQAEVQAARHAGYAVGATVLLGNPPFSGISENRGAWIRSLLRASADGQKAGYYEVDGRPLAERKHWLQDDYVKFLRYAQWRLERSGCGLIAFVTNHGYLDNVSFRGMRQRLIEAFPRMTIIDLHGNRKKREHPPEGGPDENVFGVEAGIAISLLRNPPGPCGSSIEYLDVWGTCAEKLQQLADGATDRPHHLRPASPYYLLRPDQQVDCPAYSAAWRLCDAMPVYSTAAITARDAFVVGQTREEVIERLRVFRDLTVPDAEIRRRFLTNGRSARYPAGDTRGWQLPRARQRMAAEPDWDALVRECVYRPFDRRHVCWADWMIDWPRSEVMQHMLDGGNVALVTRRQMLPTRPCNFFWVADTIVIDGLIRSDNRGSESFFPLFLNGSGSPSWPGSSPVNFAPDFLAHVERAISLRWQVAETRPSGSTFGPRELLAYIYALFHSRAYRERYAAMLRLDFPRVLIPIATDLFREMAGLGEQLLELHLERKVLPGKMVRGLGDPRAQTVSASSRSAPRGYPQFRDGQILISPEWGLDGVSEDVWNFHVGGHQVCRKWLRDRAHRAREDHEIRRYAGIVAALEATHVLAGQIDTHIARFGGWPAAFTSR